MLGTEGEQEMGAGRGGSGKKRSRRAVSTVPLERVFQAIPGRNSEASYSQRKSSPG